MFAQAIGVSVIREEESGPCEVLPHHHGRPISLDDLYGPPEHAGEGEQLHLAAPLRSRAHLGAIHLEISPMRTLYLTLTNERLGYLELLWREGEEGQVLAAVGPQLGGCLLPQLRHAAHTPGQGQLVHKTWKVKIKVTINTSVAADLQTCSRHLRLSGAGSGPAPPAAG